MNPTPNRRMLSQMTTSSSHSPRPIRVTLLPKQPELGICHWPPTAKPAHHRTRTRIERESLGEEWIASPDSLESLLEMAYRPPITTV